MLLHACISSYLLQSVVGGAKHRPVRQPTIPSKQRTERQRPTANQCCGILIQVGAVYHAAIFNPSLAHPLVESASPAPGFHYYRRELDAMPDPAAAHARRGAPWTFDAAAFLACLRAVRHQAEGAPPPIWLG